LGPGARLSLVISGNCCRIAGPMTRRPSVAAGPFISVPGAGGAGIGGRCCCRACAAVAVPRAQRPATRRPEILRQPVFYCAAGSAPASS
jgi:hypothetical protein